MQKRQIDRSESLTCCILVLSCDRYRDLWQPFFTLFEHHWGDCEFPVYLGTNCAHVDRKQVCTLKAGPEELWSKRLRFCLENIKTEYVLLMLEDFFLDQPVSNAEVNAQLELLHRLGGVSMRLFPNPPADYLRDGVGVLHTRAAFRVSLQAAIWNRSRLLALLVDEESPWEFEVAGSRRSRRLTSGFYCAPHAVVHYQHVVERGEWFLEAAQRYGACDIGCDLKARPIMGSAKSWKKKQFNRIRRSINTLRSRWLCLTYPERACE